MKVMQKRAIDVSRLGGDISQLIASIPHGWNPEKVIPEVWPSVSPILQQTGELAKSIPGVRPVGHKVREVGQHTKGYAKHLGRKALKHVFYLPPEGVVQPTRGMRGWVAKFLRKVSALNLEPERVKRIRLMEQVRGGSNPDPRLEEVGRSQGGAKIFTVDGSMVRDKYDSDFTLGGHGYVYPYIPKDEIWIEPSRSPHDTKATIAHEDFERNLMKEKGEPYSRAHERAADMETGMRLEEKVSMLAFLGHLRKMASGVAELWFSPEKGDPVNVVVEKATKPEEIRRGLMYRRHLGDHEGMMFEFPDSRRRSFWMRNTYIPLDIIFIGEDKKVAGVVENTEPLSESPRGIASSSKWVVEVPAGFCARHGIYAGTEVGFPSEE